MHMEVSKVALKLDELDWARVLQTPRGQIVYVCDASEADWRYYLEQDKNEIMEWANGKVYIVDLHSIKHEVYGGSLRYMLWRDPIGNKYPIAYGRSCVTRLHNYIPDASFGPIRRIENGYLRQWGRSLGQLDWKAGQWGVHYILCVAVTDELDWREYKLYEVDHERRAIPDQDPRPIVVLRTEVTFDSRLVLGLQPTEELPVGFPDPLVDDLYSILEHARRVV
ncbi:hypothetical protein PHYPSEUDO_003712 [Phytophthora pseudosyringae]|uniref:Uncharacterized protein n=1 Tax=Phytophthora pseudosyringae TaxID=221518 RepID=A0A8T1VR11_9STRA|nr:hypothetical protein PHYPSEUDO_003712 [Phytophthora pseudosyringae]